MCMCVCAGKTYYIIRLWGDGDEELEFIRTFDETRRELTRQRMAKTQTTRGWMRALSISRADDTERTNTPLLVPSPYVLVCFDSVHGFPSCNAVGKLQPCSTSMDIYTALAPCDRSKLTFNNTKNVPRASRS